MTETLTHEDGSSVMLTAGAFHVNMTVRGSVAPTTPTISLTADEAETLIKALSRALGSVRKRAA
jgi:hypothetical protein